MVDQCPTPGAARVPAMLQRGRLNDGRRQPAHRRLHAVVDMMSRPGTWMMPAG
jgi:hypothetical protein